MVPEYRDQIPSPGLKGFPKPVPVLDFSFSLSYSESYQGYMVDLKKVLKPLEEPHRLYQWKLFGAEGSRIDSI